MFKKTIWALQRGKSTKNVHDPYHVALHNWL